jgi:uncharacterized protein YnzC (UPF0291/DUF896 family)
MFLQNVHRAIPLTTFQRGKIMNAMQSAFNKAQNEKAKQTGKGPQQAQEFVSAEYLQKFREEILETLKHIQANQEASKQEGTDQEPPKSQEASPDTAEDASIKEATTVPPSQEEGKKKLKGKTIFKVVASSAALVAVTLGGMSIMKRRANKALEAAADSFVEQNLM